MRNQLLPFTYIYMKSRDISDVAKYIGLSMLSKGYSVSPLKLQKILYYCQSWYMVFYGRENTLFDESPQAWVNGPVYPKIYKEYRDKVDGMCDYLTEKDFGSDNALKTIKELSSLLKFTSDEIELIDSIIMLYGAKSQNQLIFLTHSEKPWVEARGALPPFERSDKELSLDTMYQFYSERHARNLAKNEA